jgi:hypothetical protein
MSYQTVEHRVFVRALYPGGQGLDVYIKAAFDLPDGSYLEGRAAIILDVMNSKIGRRGIASECEAIPPGWGRQATLSGDRQ